MSSSRYFLTWPTPGACVVVRDSAAWLLVGTWVSCCTIHDFRACICSQNGSHPCDLVGSAGVAIRFGSSQDGKYRSQQVRLLMFTVLIPYITIGTAVNVPLHSRLTRWCHRGKGTLGALY